MFAASLSLYSRRQDFLLRAGSVTVKCGLEEIYGIAAMEN